MSRPIIVEFDDDAIEHVESPFAPRYEYFADGSSTMPFWPSRQREEELFEDIRPE